MFARLAVTQMAYKNNATDFFFRYLTAVPQVENANTRFCDAASD